MFTAPRFHVKDVCWKHWVSLIWLGYWIRSKFRVRGDMWAAARHGELGARSCAVSANMIMDRTVVAEGSSQSETPHIHHLYPHHKPMAREQLIQKHLHAWYFLHMAPSFHCILCGMCVCLSAILSLAVLTIVQPTLCVALIKTNVHL